MKTKIPKQCDRRVLYLSTRHMNSEDDFDLSNSGLIADSIDGGWLVVLDNDHEEQDLETISSTLKATYALARKLGFDYLRFDSDAPVIKGFPVGEWS